MGGHQYQSLGIMPEAEVASMLLIPDPAIKSLVLVVRVSFCWCVDGSILDVIKGVCRRINYFP